MQVSQWNVADDVVEDFDAGLEYGEAESILRSVQKGDAREYLVRWGSAHILDRRATAGSVHMQKPAAVQACTRLLRPLSCFWTLQ